MTGVEDGLAKFKQDFNENLFFIMDSITAYITYIDATTLRYQFVNQAFAKAYDIPREQILGKHMSEILPAVNFQHAAPYIDAVRQGNRITYEQYFNVPIGKRWVKVDYIPELDATGKVASFIVLGTDITDRKRAEDQLKNAIIKLEALSNVDGLTSLTNRRYFEEVMNREYDRLARSGATLSFIMIDIDHFKEFNDNYGHLCGDDCLRQIAKLLSDSIQRPADLVARYGGEEFICMLPETTMEGAEIVAEKMRAGVEALCIKHRGSKTSDYVTISLGVATLVCSSVQKPIELISNADKALYNAKTKGRNRVELYR